MTSATCSRALRSRPPHRQARRGDDLLHHVVRCTPIAEVRRDGPAAQGSGLRLDLHQGHGRAAQTPTGLRPGAGIKEKCGEDTLVHVHVHSTTGVTMVSLMKAIEAGADIVDTSISSLSLGPGPQSHRGAGRNAPRNRLHDPPEQRPAAQDQGPLRQSSARVTPSSSPSSSASRRRSSTARFPAA